MSIYTLRPANGTELNFILSSWIRSFKRSSFASKIPWDIYKERQDAAIKSIMVSGAEFTVACNPEDESQAFGWISYHRTPSLPVIHYIYVKEPFRRFKIATGLIASVGNDFIYTHLTSGFERMKREGVYDPYLFFQFQKGEL